MGGQHPECNEPAAMCGAAFETAPASRSTGRIHLVLALLLRHVQFKEMFQFLRFVKNFPALKTVYLK